MFRLLRADEIDVRVATISQKGCSLLLYKDARCDMNILDETVGAYNWKRMHTRDNANCIVSLWDNEKGEWVSKEDTGTESFTEKEKGLASDSFKRACFNWGIGRELYTAPFIWVNSDKAKIETGKNGKLTTTDKFSVKEIEYTKERQIAKLVIVNQKGTVVFTSGKKSIDTKTKNEEKYVCSVCGQEVKGAKTSKGVKSAKEVFDACGGKCADCYRKEKAEDNSNVAQ